MKEDPENPGLAESRASQLKIARVSKHFKPIKNEKIIICTCTGPGGHPHELMHFYNLFFKAIMDTGKGPVSDANCC